MVEVYLAHQVGQGQDMDLLVDPPVMRPTGLGAMADLLPQLL